MNNTEYILRALKKIANALGDLCNDAVFVGGAVVSLYIDDPAAEDVRPTKDIDLVWQVASLTELEQLRIKLTEKGFVQSAENNVISRFQYAGIPIDVMSTQTIGWSSTNRWFKPGFKHLETISLGDTKLKILSLPFFLATKYSAFKDRGWEDPRTSHDFEDFVYILDNRTDMVEVLSSAPGEVLIFLKQAFREILNSPVLQEAILGNLYYQTQMERLKMIMDQIKIITDST
ncbi:MAG: nucleotidyl transferase AbiEii/AbiGii toxin family protein [Bacteroidota bacterium]